MGSVRHWDLDGEGTQLPTCRGHGSRADTRTDYLLCNAQLLPDARAFRRGPFGEVDVHAILYSAVRRGTHSPDVWRHCKPKPLVPDLADKDAHQAWELKAQAAVTQRMLDIESTLDGNFRRGDTDSLWRNWSRAMEEGLMDAMELPETARNPHRGHGQVKWTTIPPCSDVPLGETLITRAVRAAMLQQHGELAS